MTLPWSPALFALWALGLTCLFHLLLRSWARHRLSASRQAQRRRRLLSHAGVDAQRGQIVGFFHPYCNAGGGGERVLWTALAALQRDERGLAHVVYTGDQVSKEDIIRKAKVVLILGFSDMADLEGGQFQDRFDITLREDTLHVVNLKKRYLVEDATWPRFTLLGQSLGSIVLAWEALDALRPDYFFDTMGYTFTYPLAKWAGLKVASYTHYPTISTDMLRRVKQRQSGHTNTTGVAQSVLKSEAKLIYYNIFMTLYAQCLAQADLLMANSTWTCRHLKQIIGDSSKPLSIVYPPCDVRSLSALRIDTPRLPVFLSVAQFRPEKEHHVQIRALKCLLDSSEKRTDVRLVLAGSVRNENDAARVKGLRALARELQVEDHVEFIINAPYSDLLRWFGTATVGLSTMVDEHFGINVVELMAAGVIPIAHPSAGPLLDIVVPYEGEPTGFHASTSQEFANQMRAVLALSPAETVKFRQRARESVLERFSVETFEEGWSRNWKQVVKGF